MPRNSLIKNAGALRDIFDEMATTWFKDGFLSGFNKDRKSFLKIKSLLDEYIDNETDENFTTALHEINNFLKNDVNINMYKKIRDKIYENKDKIFYDIPNFKINKYNIIDMFEISEIFCSLDDRVRYTLSGSNIFNYK